VIAQVRKKIRANIATITSMITPATCVDVDLGRSLRYGADFVGVSVAIHHLQSAIRKMLAKREP